MSTKAVALAAVMAALVGCGGGKNNQGTTNDAGNMGALDGFLAQGCTSASDCPSDACSLPKCITSTNKCAVDLKPCTSDNGCTPPVDNCSIPMCTAMNGQPVWTLSPQNEGQSCTANSQAGVCTAGTCVIVPSCSSSGSSSVSCGPDNSSEQIGDNDPSDFEGGEATISTYTCAPNEAGPELAFPLTLDSTLTAPANVTVSLRLVDPNNNYKTLADQTVVDLDLIVLESTCTSTATCANPTSGSGSSAVVQGITAGTSQERVTFKADPTKSYYLVVDGKDASQVGTFLVTVESCGQCAATPQTELDCNTSTMVTANTMGGTKLLSNYTCTSGSPASFTLPGDEMPFLLTDTAGVARSITATLSGATAGTGLMVLDQSANGDCQAASCIAGATVATDNASTPVTWTTNPVDDAFSGQPVLQRFWVVVDSASNADSPFGLAISCGAYCTLDPGFDNSLSCGNGFDETMTSGATTVGGASSLTQWGPAATPCQGLTGLTGPEDVISFTPSPNGTNVYTFQLQSNDLNNDLSIVILDAGTNGAICNPSAACPMTPVAAVTGPTYSGTFTTDVKNDKTANVTLSAIHGHSYLIVIDGKDPAGASFDLAVSGTSSISGCQ